MGLELGRISGPLLSENLLRNGVNLAFEDDLIYLDVNNLQIGIKTASPSQQLEIAGTARTENLKVDTKADIADFTFQLNNIQNRLGGAIYIVANGPNGTVSVDRIAVGASGIANLSIDTDTITNVIPNSSIDIKAYSLTDYVNFNTNRFQVTGNLHSNGSITADGNIIFGSADTDTVDFNADVASNIAPNLNNEYSLGTNAKRWQNLYSELFNGTALSTTTLAAGNIDFLTTQGQQLYVSVNGDDSYLGTHLHNTFRTVKQALSVATPGSEIIIFPGTYTEEFPLTIPEGVSVRGMGLRSVIIQPTVETSDKDAFLLNAGTTVSFLTVSNFYYNSIDNTGHAFRFANGMNTQSRSPYVQYVTVITKGSVISPSDTLGFDQGDAGRGAYVDGSVVDPACKDPAMLFSAVTFITPNADALTLTNGVRVEWLNSFTYFANKGIHLVRGTLGFASLGLKFNTELRSIGSANVYGNYGAIADGADTLAYLIGHNFGYIGTGKDSNNDYGLVIQSQEVVELNDGVIYYDSMDHKGDYRVGDVFYVNQQTGAVTFNAQAIDFSAGGSIVFEGEGNGVIINAQEALINYIRFYDNNIDSTQGPVNLFAQSGTTTLNTQVNITGNLDVTGDLTVSGNIFLGDNPLDTVNIIPRLTQTIEPDLTNTYSLGNNTTPKLWNTAFLTLVNIDNVIQISNNEITTLSGNTALRLVADGSGIVNVTTTDVAVSNNLQVVGTTDLHDVVIGNIGLIGSYLQTGNSDRTGDTNITGNLTVQGSNTVQFEDIKFTSNEIATTLSNNNLELRANGTGIVKILSNNVEITHDLNVLGTPHLNIVGVTNTLLSDTLAVDDVFINDNYITTLTTNRNLELHAAGTGLVSVPLKNVDIVNSLTVAGVTTIYGSSTLQNVEIVGLVNLTGSIDQTGNTDVDGNLSVRNITGHSYLESSKVNILSNVISAVDTNSDIIFSANGLGGVVLDSRLKITDNVISNVWASATTDEQKSIKFSPDGTGYINIEAFTSLVIPVGNNISRTLSVQGELRQNSTTKLFEGWSPSGLESLTGLYDSDRNTYITAELLNGANDNTLRFGINGTVVATVTSSSLSTSNIFIDDIRLFGNTVNNRISGNDLVFETNGTGAVVLDDMRFTNDAITNATNGALTIASTGTGYIKFAGNLGIVIPTGNNADRRDTPEMGEVRHNSQVGYMEVYNGTAWIPAVGTLGAAPLSEVLDIMDLWSLVLG